MPMRSAPSLAPMLAGFILLLSATSSSAIISVRPVRCDKLLRNLFVDLPTVAPAAIAAACSPTVEWVDMDRTEP
eukprot:7312956-Prymnesium_polylepis.1